MNTPAHLILGIAAFGKTGQPRVTAAAALGALMPDLSLYLLVGGALAMGIPAQTVFDELYFSDAWQSIFAIDNSVFVWGMVLALGLWRQWVPLTAFASAGLLHIALDLPLHHDDGRAHFWPVSDWIFESPLSYWDTAQGALWVAPIETALVIALGIWCFTWLGAIWSRGLLIVALAAQLATSGVWALVFEAGA